MRSSSASGTALALLLVTGMPVCAQTPTSDPLEAGFANPPTSARPRVWWHWMNGNVTREGIRLDLEWMRRIGLGGFQNFDASLGTPKVVDRRLVYMTPEWKEAFRYTVENADRLGLEMAIAGSPGWSESGGPWVTPKQAMKKLVWSETTVTGGATLSIPLPKPPDVAGPFQNIALDEFPNPGAPPTPRYYADAAVLAYRIPVSASRSERAQITSSGGAIDAALLDDGDLSRGVSLPKAPIGRQSWIQLAYAQPVTVRAITLAVKRPFNPLAQFLPPGESGQELQASDDGENWRTVAQIPGGGVEQHTLAFPEVRARWFRVVFTTLPDRPDPLASLGIEGLRTAPVSAHLVTELVLHSSARVHRFEEKAAFATSLLDLGGLATPPAPQNAVIRKDDVIDLTRRVRTDGTLQWTPPPGRWRILRLGASLTGHKNAPASPEATGLEVDKLSKPYVRSYFETYLNQYRDAAGALMGERGLGYLITDSWEAGVQNWTDDMLREFARRRGYDPRPFLPAMTGCVVESAEASDRFLWDYRRTLADLVAENHYDQLTDILHRRGMGRYSESHESGRALIADGMEVKRRADVPMSAMWTQLPGVNGEQFGYNADIRESASVAHLYGQNLVAAESLTAASGAWAWCPETLKPTADKELAMGLNRFVIHTSVHQPLVDRRPGLALGPFGQWFTRNETWAEQAAPWISYLARCSYLLQQGRFVADIAWYYGEDTNVTALYGARAPEVPAGYNFDYINSDALRNRLSVRNGMLVTPNGMRYRILVLDRNSRQMPLPVLRKIQALVEAGAVVVGERPTNSPSLADDAAAFDAIADALWSGPTGEHRIGAGRVIDGKTTAEALALLRISPDFACAPAARNATVLSVHRALPGADLYFVNNRTADFVDIEATFRTAGREAELWHPDTGAIEPAGYRISGGSTTVPLSLEPYGTVFVVFRKPARKPAVSLPASTPIPLLAVDGEWHVAFPSNLGAPDSIAMDRLSSWSEHPNPGVRYFSGTATYRKTVTLPATAAGRRLLLDLGEVKQIAEVTVNGKPLGILWKAPFRVDATSALRSGENSLEIKVTNLWVNRLIGDQQPGAAKRYTFTTQAFYKADSPLLPSGLLGPVRVLYSGK